MKADLLKTHRLKLARWIEGLPGHEMMPRSIQKWVQERTTFQELDRSWAIRMCGLMGLNARGTTRAIVRALEDNSRAN